jgi:hypothetical protein
MSSGCSICSPWACHQLESEYRIACQGSIWASIVVASTAVLLLLWAFLAIALCREMYAVTTGVKACLRQLEQERARLLRWGAAMEVMLEERERGVREPEVWSASGKKIFRQDSRTVSGHLTRTTSGVRSARASGECQETHGHFTMLQSMSSAAAWLQATVQCEEDVQRMRMMQKVEERRIHKLHGRLSRAVRDNMQEDIVPMLTEISMTRTMRPH